MDLSAWGLRITLSAEVLMPTMKPKSPPKAAKRSPAKSPGSKPSLPARGSRERAKLIDDLARRLNDEVKERLGPDATFEQESDAAFEIMRDVLWKREEDRLRESVTDADEVEVDGKTYRKMQQASSAIYFGRFGAHHIEEPLYREVGVHNGPTIKPIELRVGIIERMLPDMARVVGELNAERGSRGIERVLRAVGYASPSRAFLADHVTALGVEIASIAAELEETARERTAVPSGVVSVSCGLDRMSVRMSEAVPGSTCTRREPYERAPPPTKEYHYRKAWVGSASAYDAEGNEMMTWRVSADAGADPAQIAERVAADVAWVVEAHPAVAVHCIQDAAPELKAMVAALENALPADVEAVELIDFEHLMGYLDDVVDALDPNDKHDMKGWYRGELLRDDGAIDRVSANLRAQAKRLPGRNTKPRRAIAAALRYARGRKHLMRYASHYKANLPIGSGATESTCWQMQQRVKLPGQSWEPGGLRGTLAIRSLVLSERWAPAWDHYASLHRAEVTLSP